jgi:hypothetical protein
VYIGDGTQGGVVLEGLAITCRSLGGHKGQAVKVENGGRAVLRG